MGVNKFVYGGTTKFDLTGDDVTQADVLSGKIFHNAAGNQQTGTLQTQEKSVTPSSSQQIITPDSGKLLSKVTVAAVTPAPTYPTSISVTQNPTKTEYTEGDAFDTTGMVVSANMADGTTQNVTSSSTTSPANGDTLATTDTTVSVGYNFTVQNVPQYNVPFATSFNIIVNAKPVAQWTSGTDYEIYQALLDHYAGKVDLHEKWNVGDTRQVTISQVAKGNYSSGLSSRTLSMILMNAGGKTLTTAVSGKTECVFIVGVSEPLYNMGDSPMFITAPSGRELWKDSDLRTWLNNQFRAAFPTYMKNSFRQHKSICWKADSPYYEGIDDYFSVAAEGEVYGSTEIGSSYETSNVTHFKYYKDDASARYVSTPGAWLRTPDLSNNSNMGLQMSNTSKARATNGTNTGPMIMPICVI